LMVRAVVCGEFAEEEKYKARSTSCGVHIVPLWGRRVAELRGFVGAFDALDEPGGMWGGF
jgi:hypothetical protein